MKSDGRQKVAVKVLNRSALTASRRFSRNIAKKEDINNEVNIMKKIENVSWLFLFFEK